MGSERVSKTPRYLGKAKGGVVATGNEISKRTTLNYLSAGPAARGVGGNAGFELLAQQSLRMERSQSRGRRRNDCVKSGD